jgi:hypothetical protein
MLNNEFELQITNLGVSSADVTYTGGAVTGTVLIIVALSILLLLFCVQILRHPYTVEAGARPTALILHGGTTAVANRGPSNVAVGGGGNKVGSNAVHPEEAVTNAGTSGGGSKASSSSNPLKAPSSPPRGVDPLTVLQQDNDRVREELRKVRAEMEKKIKELEMENLAKLQRLQEQHEKVVSERDETIHRMMEMDENQRRVHAEQQSVFTEKESHIG